MGCALWTSVIAAVATVSTAGGSVSAWVAVFYVTVKSIVALACSSVTGVVVSTAAVTTSTATVCAVL